MSLYKDISTLQETNIRLWFSLEAAFIAVSRKNSFFDFRGNIIRQDRINSGSKSIDTDIITNFSFYNSVF